MKIYSWYLPSAFFIVIGIVAFFQAHEPTHYFTGLVCLVIGLTELKKSRNGLKQGIDLKELSIVKRIMGSNPIDNLASLFLLYLGFFTLLDDFLKISENASRDPGYQYLMALSLSLLLIIGHRKSKD